MLMVSATASASVQACLQKNNKDIVRLWIFFFIKYGEQKIWVGEQKKREPICLLWYS
jgi:hypothetical protein